LLFSLDWRYLQLLCCSGSISWSCCCCPTPPPPPPPVSSGGCGAGKVVDAHSAASLSDKKRRHVTCVLNFLKHGAKNLLQNNHQIGTCPMRLRQKSNFEKYNGCQTQLLVSLVKRQIGFRSSQNFRILSDSDPQHWLSNTVNVTMRLRQTSNFEKDYLFCCQPQLMGYQAGTSNVKF
jgi:hypothetical protein